MSNPKLSAALHQLAAAVNAVAEALGETVPAVQQQPQVQQQQPQVQQQQPAFQQQPAQQPAFQQQPVVTAASTVTLEQINSRIVELMRVSGGQAMSDLQGIVSQVAGSPDISAIPADRYAQVLDTLNAYAAQHGVAV